MAIAFARVTYHSRSNGQSAVACAAYRSGEKIQDERTGIIHNYLHIKKYYYLLALILNIKIEQLYGIMLRHLKLVRTLKLLKKLFLLCLIILKLVMMIE